MTAVVFLLAALLGLLALFVVVLAIPLRVRVATAPGRGVLVELTWLFGLVRVRPSTRKRPASDRGDRRKGRAERRRAREQRRAKRRQRRHSGRAGLRKAWAGLTTPGLLARTVDLVVDLVRLARPSSIRGSARVGLDDPADTGMLWGALGPLSATLAAFPNTTLSLEPDFTRARLELDGEADFHFVPLAAGMAVVRFALSLAVVRATFRVVRA